MKRDFSELASSLISTIFLHTKQHKKLNAQTFESYFFSIVLQVKMETKRRYREYLADPNPGKTVPRTTAWRNKKRDTCEKKSSISSEDIALQLAIAPNKNDSASDSLLGSRSDIDNEAFEEEEDCHEDVSCDSSNDSETNSLYSEDYDSQDDMECTEECSDSDDKPLFPGCPLTALESVVFTMQFSLTHKLSGTALSDLIHLLNAHFPETSVTSVNKLKNIVASFKDTSFEAHYYCQFCFKYFGCEVIEVCTSCGSDNLMKKYFVTMSLAAQIKDFFKGK